MTDSKFTQDEIQQQRTARIEEGGLKELLRQTRGRWFQKFPLIGRFIAHGTVFYWDQLDKSDPPSTFGRMQFVTDPNTTVLHDLVWTPINKLSGHGTRHLDAVSCSTTAVNSVISLLAQRKTCLLARCAVNTPFPSSE